MTKTSFPRVNRPGLHDERITCLMEYTLESLLRDAKALLEHKWWAAREAAAFVEHLLEHHFTVMPAGTVRAIHELWSESISDWRIRRLLLFCLSFQMDDPVLLGNPEKWTWSVSQLYVNDSPGNTHFVDNFAVAEIVLWERTHQLVNNAYQFDDSEMALATKIVEIATSRRYFPVGCGALTYKVLEQLPTDAAIQYVIKMIDGAKENERSPMWVLLHWLEHEMAPKETILPALKRYWLRTKGDTSSRVSAERTLGKDWEAQLRA